MIDLCSSIQQEYLNLAEKLGYPGATLHATTSPHVGDPEATVYQLCDSLGTFIASGCLSYFPGCCGIGVLHTARAESPKLLRWMFELRKAIGIHMSWGMLQQT